MICGAPQPRNKIRRPDSSQKRQCPVQSLVDQATGPVTGLRTTGTRCVHLSHARLTLTGRGVPTSTAGRGGFWAAAEAVHSFIFSSSSQSLSSSSERGGAGRRRRAEQGSEGIVRVTLTEPCWTSSHPHLAPGPTLSKRVVDDQVLGRQLCREPVTGDRVAGPARG